MHLAVDVEREFFVHDERPLGLDQSSCCGGAMPLMQAGSRLFRKATQGNIVCGRGSARAGPVYVLWRLSAGPPVVEVVRDFLASVGQFEKFFFDNGIFGLFGQFPVFGRLLSQVVGVMEHGVIGGCTQPRPKMPGATPILYHHRARELWRLTTDLGAQPPTTDSPARLRR